MKIACTGFVSGQEGSVTAANAVLLRELLKSGYEIDFFSKPSFVDPRPSVGMHESFRFRAVTNHGTDAIGSRLARIPIVNFLARLLDSFCYNRALVRAISFENKHERYDACIWLGDYAHGHVDGVPTVSFTQGPPGTDARSIVDRGREIRALAGFAFWIKWRALAALRLSRLGLPSFTYSDHFIVGSQWAALTLEKCFGVPSSKVSTLSYPIDLGLFRPKEMPVAGNELPLRVLWLGRIVPRKRLDLFLKGAELAIRDGFDLEITIVGKVGFAPGYEKLIERFPFPNRLTWTESIARGEIPELICQHDSLLQPSDHENFGSSVAEAQACGLPVIVGATNGNGDYLTDRDIRLKDDDPETLRSALAELCERKRSNRLGTAKVSRESAERYFAPERICRKLREIIERVIEDRKLGARR